MIEMGSQAAHVLATSVIAALTTGVAVAWIRRWALRKQLLDRPNERSSHRVPTPRLGGVGIVVGLALALLTEELRGGYAGDLRLLTLAVSVASALAILSLLDDVFGMPVRLRLAAHIVAAAVIVWNAGYFDAVVLPERWGFSLGWLGVPVTIFWLVGFLNAFNFMDGIDGIAGGHALVAGAAWGAIGLSLGEPHVATLGAVLAGCAAGFLWHNWPPARIFMGDAGSASLGFLLAVVPLLSARPSQLALPALLIAWPFAFDTTFTLLRRWRRGEDLFMAHRSHLYQRLNQTGWSHRSVSFLYTGSAALGAWLAVTTVLESGPSPLFLAVVLLGTAGALHMLVVSRERRVQQQHS
jgi:UDP-N-acetylmuramyl pentapeptide phosphotransferase/UDP-N-acetylglucosamine-1-phosphate transferase